MTSDSNGSGDIQHLHFEFVQDIIHKLNTIYGLKTYEIQTVMKNIGNTISHEEAQLEFQIKFDKYLHCVHHNDYVSPYNLKQADITAVLINNNKGLKLIWDGYYVQLNIKRQIPTTTQQVGISVKHFNLYRLYNVLVVFAIPTPNHPDYYKKLTKTTAREHIFYLCYLDEPSYEFNGYYYFKLSDLLELTGLKDGQLPLTIFFKNVGQSEKDKGVFN